MTVGLKGRQAKLKDLHDTTRVVDVSCASISFLQSSLLSTTDEKGPKRC